ncbi:FAD-dependent oxidoreductase [Oceanicella sp. SM1341]|uniref:GcvT family protein n=1 Tax=Oceanicella sp. SM1341 TaxID=1548889 RepID=UPI000E4E053C|nr:FAD-dependent oxidoreductase [Oceanicella sp. SM1341]
MRQTARVVVIGGGVVGCSVLYHLTRLGWSDVVLVERSELTSGSTWHAAGGFHTLNADTNMAALQGYTIRLYRELEEITGLSCGLHHVGGVTLADSPERLDYLKAERAKHRYMGLETEIIGPEEIRALSPITNTEGVLGALYDPLDGHLDPSGTTHAYAKAARMAGAEIILRTPVLETNPRPDGTWDVVTPAGTIHAEHVVNAAGLWAREVGALAGLTLPLHPMEHQYLVTEETPEVYERGAELPHVMDPGGESYLRQEGRGLCIGFYEQPCDPWAVDGTPADFGHELLENKLDRISDSVEFAYRRFPVLQRAGIKTIINGPFTFAPDGNPLVGPVPGLRNYWSACAVMAGFSQGGGVGLSLAQWMIEGEPERDVFAMDVARFGMLHRDATAGRWITPGYTRLKVKENYQRRFSVSYPNEELPAARPFQTTPVYSEWKAQGAVFGAHSGMEVVNYFARPGELPHEVPSFRRSNAFEAVAGECAAVRGAVGINEIHNFGKYLVTGPGAEGWLAKVMAGRLPKPGRITLSPMLSPRGRIIGDFTITCLGPQRYQLTASFGAQAFHMRWFESHLPPSGVRVENVSTRRIGFQIAGPRAREWLGRVAHGDVGGLRFMDAREMDIGPVRALVQRVSYTGDLGYELHVDWESQLALYHALMAASEGLGAKPFGMRAMMSLRLEKFFGSWLREYGPDYMPGETGLGRFVDHARGGFIGAEAAAAEMPARRLCAFVVDADEADVVAYEPIWIDGAVQGFVTSGGYAHHAQASVALGFVPVERAREGLQAEIEILGRLRPARLVTTPLFDADGARMRG